MPQGHRPHLDRDQLGALRRAVKGLQATVRAFHAGDPDQARRNVLDALEDVVALHRRIEPAAYARRMGTRP